MKARQQLVITPEVTMQTLKLLQLSVKLTSDDYTGLLHSNVYWWIVDKCSCSTKTTRPAAAIDKGTTKHLHGARCLQLTDFQSI